MRNRTSIAASGNLYGWKQNSHEFIKKSSLIKFVSLIIIDETSNFQQPKRGQTHQFLKEECLESMHDVMQGH